MHIQAISRKSQARLQTLARATQRGAHRHRRSVPPGAAAEIVGVALMLAVFLTAAIMV